MKRRTIGNGLILPPRRAARALQRLRRGGKRIVFTNGCFDLIHPGHVSLLERARALGDLLVVGVNSDRSVRLLKGPGRPIMKLGERMEILAGLRAVDYVVPFGAETPAYLIRLIRPDILVKGGDYRKSEIVGRSTVEADGGSVITIPLRRGHSSSRLTWRAARVRAERRVPPARRRGRP